MNIFFKLLETGAQEPGLLAQLSPIIMIAGLGLVFYFFLWRPQKKQQKETEDLRSSVERGDVITTIGGVVGRVIVIKDDNILIETSGDKTKIQIQRWAVRSIEKKAE